METIGERERVPLSGFAASMLDLMLDDSTFWFDLNMHAGLADDQEARLVDQASELAVAVLIVWAAGYFKIAAPDHEPAECARYISLAYARALEKKGLTAAAIRRSQLRIYSGYLTAWEEAELKGREPTSAYLPLCDHFADQVVPPRLWDTAARRHYRLEAHDFAERLTAKLRAHMDGWAKAVDLTLDEPT
jgi:hypothetical protein